MFVSFLNVLYTPSYHFQFTYKFYVQSKYLYFDQTYRKKYQHSTTPNQYCQIRTYSQICTRDGFQFVFNHVNVLVLAHALPTRISPHIASPIVTFLSYMSNSTSGVLTTSVLEYAVLIVVLHPSIYIGPMWRREM